MGSRGQTVTVARHMVRSLMSRVKYTVKERATTNPGGGPNPKFNYQENSSARLTWRN